VDRNFATYDLAKQVLGYTPGIGREEGIAQTWAWYQEHVFTA
jgi:nucleoside-diphosphate-sugar epimerase